MYKKKIINEQASTRITFRRLVAPFTLLQDGIQNTGVELPFSLCGKELYFCVTFAVRCSRQRSDQYHIYKLKIHLVWLLPSNERKKPCNVWYITDYVGNVGICKSINHILVYIQLYVTTQSIDICFSFAA